MNENEAGVNSFPISDIGKMKGTPVWCDGSKKALRETLGILRHIRKRLSGYPDFLTLYSLSNFSLILQQNFPDESM